MAKIDEKVLKELEIYRDALRQVRKLIEETQKKQQSADLPFKPGKEKL